MLQQQYQAAHHSARHDSNRFSQQDIEGEPKLPSPTHLSQVS